MRAIALPPPLSIGRIFGIPIRLDWSWMPTFPLYWWAIAGVYLPNSAPGRSPLAYWALGLVTVFLFVVSVVVHELAHALVARTEGLEIHDITLHIFGGMARLGSEPATPSAELKIAVVGPGASFLLGVLFLGLDELVFFGTTFVAEGRVLRHLGVVNLVLATFNLLPGFPLDGGRALKAVLWKRHGDPAAALRTARSAGRSVAIALVGVGVWVYLYTDRLTGLYSLSIGVVLLLVLGLKEGRAARTSTAAAVMRRPAVAVEPTTTVERLVDEVLPAHRQTAFFVTAGGRLHGVVTLDALRSVPRDAWPRTPVSRFMHPVDESHFVVATAPAGEARRKVETNGVGYVAVLDGDGMVVGSVHPEELKSRR